jgi:hypothetical protein
MLPVEASPIPVHSHGTSELQVHCKKAMSGDLLNSDIDGGCHRPDIIGGEMFLPQVVSSPTIIVHVGI